MNIVQSTWFGNSTDIAGRWKSPKLALFNFALSFHTLRQFYPQLILHTDQTGCRLLIEQLELAYDDVVVDQDYLAVQDGPGVCFDTYWVLRKLHTYAVQKTTFIHVDNDVYLFKPFAKTLTEAPLYAQNLEINGYYRDMLRTVQQHFDFVPDWLREARETDCLAVNAGLMGGENVAFYKQVYAEIILFLQRNRDCLHHLGDNDINIFLEQFMLKLFADHLNLGWGFQYDHIYRENLSYNAYKLHDTPKLVGYIHMMNCKTNDTVCEAMAKTLYWENRQLYDRCLDVSQLYERKDAIHKPNVVLPRHEKENLAFFFYRTQQVAEALPTNAQLDFRAISLLTQSVSQALTQLSDTKSDVLADVFYFESVRYWFAKSLDESCIQRIYTNFLIAKERLESEQFPAYRLRLSEQVEQLATRWLWVQTNEFFSTRNKLYADNLTKEPGYVETLIFYYPELQKLKEQQLDPLNLQIMHYAGMDWTAGQIIVFLSEFFQAQGEVEGVDAVVESRIRYLVYQGVFQLV